MPARGDWRLALALCGACASSGAWSQEGKLAATVGELVQIEAQRALSEARKTSPHAAAQVAAPSLLPKGAAAGASDLVELLGIYKRERLFAADVALNGVVRYVEPGHTLGNYAIQSIGDACVYLTDPNGAQLVRCVSMARSKRP